MGRKKKVFEPVQQQVFLHLISQGESQKGACEGAKITPNFLHKYVTECKREKATAEQKDFLTRLEHAKEEAKKGRRKQTRRRKTFASTLTVEVKAQLVRALKAGAHPKLACKFAGVRYSTLQEWRKEGAVQSSGPYSSLEFELQQIEGQKGIELLEKIARASEEKKDWKGLVWLLKKSCPDIYGEQAEPEQKVIHPPVYSQPYTDPWLVNPPLPDEEEDKPN